MGFLDTVNDMEIDTSIEQDETIVDTYSVEVIDDVNDENNENTINEDEIIIIDDSTEQTETSTEFSEDTETTTETVIEMIDYTEHLNYVNDSLNTISMLCTVILCVLITKTVFGFLHIRKEGDL